jgi:hypothetical protein
MHSTAKTWALRWYALSLLVLIPGTIVAVQLCPGGFDWQYTVMSALASKKHNPQGGVWFASALGLGLLFLWPVAGYFRTRVDPAKRAGKIGVRSLRFGLVCGVLMSLERVFIYHLSDRIHKGHEILALFCFVGVYGGVLLLYFDRLRRRVVPWWTALVVALPLLAIGATQLYLYVAQHDLGWVDTDWRALGVPVWLSFAFWQWLATAILWAAIGQLAFSGEAQTSR